MNNKKEIRFNVGDAVITKKYEQDTPPFYNASNMDKYVGVQGEITSITMYHNGNKAYLVHNFYWPESALELANGTITETATKTGIEYQFEIGKDYEFSDGEDWVKGKAVGTVDYEGQRNFVADIGGKLSVFESIRPIQPRKITRWINICPDGRVLRKSYETEQEARNKACQGGMTDCKQVELKGVIAP